MRKCLFGAAIVAALIAPAPSVASTGTVTVDFDVSLLDDALDYAVCTLVVPRDEQEIANGFDVLDQAVADGCIDSYDAVDFGGYGRFLTCIDGICGQDAPTWAVPVPTVWAGTTWSFTLNDQYATVGLEGYNAAPGDEVGLTYSTYAFPA